MWKKILLTLFIALLGALTVLAKADVTLKLSGLGTIEGEQVLLETFDAPDVWEAYSSPNGVELGVENGVYRAYAMNKGYVWGLNQQQHTDVILEVEATPLSLPDGSGFGVMCRADVSNNGDGYYFMITTGGYYSIQAGMGDEIVPLLDWQESDAIHPDIDRNTIRAVCVDDELAMYVNGELLAEIEDDTYPSGYTGLSVAADGGEIDVAFDNLIIYTVTY